MKQLISLVALGLALAVGGAHAADEKAPTAQQNKMKTCNADAKTKDIKGDERKKFMSECLSAKPAAAAADAGTSQQNKMKTCNADAKTKDLKGDDRKKFMSECLSAK
ncbi:MAG: phosphate starvation-inducible protein PsiF [Curvibacter sp. RIFCSPHIGHO2_12_FULL_63_18]|uniref:PsiF family protein n=1 Tax=Rhodoferax sp. TaxID=50421 RepID=UPI0008BDD5C3|nr:PsiF family protein [Rhodoferax sp.]OGO97270.1 MAG: phosphate starvation-inducible protein PsiF [Curvibacter sp. GWA2_63_95]OGP02438.1 MAG: phosphate starvation-inducible protein PsiF [Curvibacter sp. RIFCSPHIGHO2_12_FULL_63_18]HCX81696.1 phosphate starvation-inducible protein PsiF [Rhodoferax sp.]